MWLSTVTCTGAEAVTAPEASMARTASVCAPLPAEKLSQVAMKGAPATVARGAPSSWNSVLAVPAGTDALSATGPASTEPVEMPLSAGAGGGAGGASAGGAGGCAPGVAPGRLAAAGGVEPLDPPQQMVAIAASTA